MGLNQVVYRWNYPTPVVSLVYEYYKIPDTKQADNITASEFQISHACSTRPREDNKATVQNHKDVKQMRVYACGVYLRGCALEDFLSPEFHFSQLLGQVNLELSAVEPEGTYVPETRRLFPL